MRRGLTILAPLFLTLTTLSGSVRAAEYGGVNASLSHYVGQATWTVGPTRNPYVLSWLSVQPYLRYRFVTLEANLDTWLEWTETDSQTYRFQPDLIDPYAGLRLRVLSLFDDHLVAQLRASAAPGLSLASLQAGRLARATAGGSVSGTIPVVDVTASLSVVGVASLLHPTLSSQALVAGRDYTGRTGGVVTPKSCITRSDAERAAYACGSLPSAAEAISTFSLSWSPLDGAVSLGASLTAWASYSAYVSPDDDYTSRYARPGIGTSIATQGTTWISLSPLHWLTVSVGTFSGQGLWTADARSWRFPFWDWLSVRENLSSVYFDTSISF